MAGCSSRIYSFVLLLTVRPVGIYLARVLKGKRTWLDPVLRPIERLIYKLCGVNADHEMNWREYAFAMLGFSAVSMVVTYAIERAAGRSALEPAAPRRRRSRSCVEHRRQLHHQHQLAVLHAGIDHELSHRDGRACDAQLLLGRRRYRRRRRPHSRHQAHQVCAPSAISGSIRRAPLLYILLPGSLIYALLLVARAFLRICMPTRLRTPSKGQTQTIGQGPVASQEAIKMLGTNGGGFFNANSAHPFENPTPFSNFLQILSIFIIPAGLTYTLGRMTGSPGHGWAVFAAMFILFAAGFTTLLLGRVASASADSRRGSRPRTATAPGGNMEGKEVRNGIAEIALFATITTDASCGAVNGMHDSFTPLGGLVPLTNIMLGEVIFGGVGAGLYGMLIFVVQAVFIAGLMVGRTPEYLGKKIEAYDVKMAMLYVLIFPLDHSLAHRGLCADAQRRARPLNNAGPHGLQRDSLRLYFRRRQQWLSLCWSRAELVVQRHDGLGHAHRPLPDDDSRAGARRQPGAEEERSAFPRNLSRQHAAVHRAACRRGAILGALTFFPALSLGPILEHLQLKQDRFY